MSGTDKDHKIRRRFFWGFMGKQERWLNKMSDSGLRLVGTSGRLTYRFEDCAPSQYRYKVEFIGHKSGADADKYAAFLEDCGYHVYFRNIDLDYSVAKAELRPWADKGGRVSVTGGTYNRELLIVEKENDGKPFELHTSEEDIREYKKTLRRPLVFWAALAAAVILLIMGGNIMAGKLGNVSGVGNVRSALRVGYVGSETDSRWKGRYSRLDGVMKKTMRPKGKLLTFDVETTSGTLSVEVFDKNGELILKEENIGTNSIAVPVSDKVTVRLIAADHCGSFDIS